MPDGLDFDRKCDQSLPLEDLLSEPDPMVRQLLKDIDRSKTSVWALTNAYITVRFYFEFRVGQLIREPGQHATRVLQILKLDDLIEDIVFCDYAVPDFSCKPEAEYYHKV